MRRQPAVVPNVSESPRYRPAAWDRGKWPRRFPGCTPVSPKHSARTTPPAARRGSSWRFAGMTIRCQRLCGTAALCRGATAHSNAWATNGSCSAEAASVSPQGISSHQGAVSYHRALGALSVQILPSKYTRSERRYVSLQSARARMLPPISSVRSWGPTISRLRAPAFPSRYRRANPSTPRAVDRARRGRSKTSTVTIRAWRRFGSKRCVIELENHRGAPRVVLVASPPRWSLHSDQPETRVPGMSHQQAIRPGLRAAQPIPTLRTAP